MIELNLGFSPCPNDTFIFDALVNNKIDTEGIRFNPVMEDVQTLNQWALEGKLDVTKLSFGVLPLVLNRYALLNSGSALGNGVGPLLITNDNMRNRTIEECLVAIPGKDTTAHVLFTLAYPAAKSKVFLRYNEIENFVMENKGPGVIIHENRFTYEQKGLVKIADLGDYWERTTGSAIPLGGIVIRRELDVKLQQQVDKLIQRSLGFAFQHYPELNNFVRKHAQEMSEDVMRKHIDLYVNRFSFELGSTGRLAVKKFIETYCLVNNQERQVEDIFVEVD